ncbi:hypothetical protein BJX61DRAFT_302907 [Aspergillus egyptiacus]|nr:hypothetical protein BJX61DRAFT_302907 [Aspergillus egyptiacus]
MYFNNKIYYRRRRISHFVTLLTLNNLLNNLLISFVRRHTERFLVNIRNLVCAGVLRDLFPSSTCSLFCQLARIAHHRRKMAGRT